MSKPETFVVVLFGDSESSFQFEGGHLPPVAYAIHFPSGDHAASWPFGTRRPPGVSQIEVAPVVQSRRVYATARPSGDGAGLLPYATAGKSMQIGMGTPPVAGARRSAPPICRAHEAVLDPATTPGGRGSFGS